MLFVLALGTVLFAQGASGSSDSFDTRAQELGTTGTDSIFGTSKPKIAIPAFQAIGNFSDDERTLIEQVIQTAIISKGTFEVLERSQLKDLQNLQDFELSDIGLLKDGLLKAQYVLFGTVGTLFDRLVITTRLVDVATGKNLFASSIFTRRGEQFYEDIPILGDQINTTAINYQQNVTLDSIKKAVSAQDWTGAKNLIDVYLLKNQVTVELDELRQQITPNLYDAYIREAENALRNRLFSNARDSVNSAISLRPSDDAYQLRSRINREEALYTKEAAERDLIRQRQAEEASRKRIEALVSDPFQDAETYLRELSPWANHVGVSSNWFLPASLALPEGWGSAGFEYFVSFGFPETRNPSSVEVSNLGWLGLDLVYDQRADPASLLIGARLSPWLGVTGKLALLNIGLGLDGGVRLLVNSNLTLGYRFGVTAGLMALAELRIVRSLGFWVSGRVEWNYWIELAGVGSFGLRASAGLSF